MRYAGLALVIGCCLLPAGPCPGATSALWGTAGERWSPAGRLPDFSHAGYRAGAAALPSPPVRGNVKDFGARGDGITDDTKAFEDAIAQVSGGAVFIPRGRYVISRVLYIRKSRLVLRGEGPDRSVLIFPRNLLDVLGRRAFTGEDGNWSWAGGFLWVEGEERTRKLADVVMAARRGENALTLSSTAGLAAGQTIRLMMTDADGSLGRHIHADQMEAHASLLNRRLVRFPAPVRAVQGNRIVLDRPLRLDVRLPWKPEIHVVTSALSEVGLEGFSMEFPAVPYPGHYQEVGSNGIWVDGAWNSWIRNVAINNCDSGILLERTTFCTVDRVRLTADPGRSVLAPPGLHNGRHAGHHGIQHRGGDDCLISNFRIETRFLHDLTVENAVGTVFMRGRGRDLCFDHHTCIPYENLFTELDLGAGTRPWVSNGSADPESGARETFWNIRSETPIKALATRKGTWPQMNLVGVPTDLRGATAPEGPWIEPVEPGTLEPRNLYVAQLVRRIGVHAQAVLAQLLAKEGAP